LVSPECVQALRFVLWVLSLRYHLIALSFVGVVLNQKTQCAIS